MKKNSWLFTIVLFCLLISQQLAAQTLATGSKFIGNEGTLRFFELYDNEGNRIKMASEMGVTGTPLLRGGKAVGMIHYQNGSTFSDTSMNLSLLNNTLYFTRSKKLFQIVLPVDSFTLTFPDEDNGSVIYHFKSGFPAIDDHDASSLYEVLFEGQNLQLVQWNRKTVKEIFNYGSAREKQFVLEQQLYVYFKKEKTIAALKKSLPAIKKTLSAYSAIIKNYLAENKISARDTEEIADLIAYIDRHQ